MRKRQPIVSILTGGLDARQYLPALISGCLLAFSFPRPELYPLAFVALVPLLMSLRGMALPSAFRAGLSTGFIYFMGTCYWVYHSMYHFGGVPLLASLAIAALLALYLSLYTALFGVLYAFLTRGKGKRGVCLPAMILAPLLWCALEYLRGHALTGFPWSSLGYSQYKFLTFIQFADIAGVYGVSFLIVAINGAIVDAICTIKKKEGAPSTKAVIAGGAVLIAIVATVLLYGRARLSETAQGPPVKVSVVQGNIDQSLKWNPEYQDQTVEIYRLLSVRAKKDDPALIVWPESAMPFYFGGDLKHSQAVTDFARTLQTRILTGTIIVRGGSKGRKYDLSNSAVLVNPKGEVEYIYDKVHMVPFGEYVPLRPILFFVDKIAGGIGDYVPGHSVVPANTPAGRFGTVICYEIIFPELVRTVFRDGGDFLVTITNDAWFGTTSGPYQHWSMAVLRAIENRKPVVRAANTGISGFIDSWGRIKGSTRLFERTVLTEEIITDPRITFYTAHGDWLPQICTVLVIILSTVALRRPQNDKRRYKACPNRPER